MAKKFRKSYWFSDNIQEVEIFKESEHSVWYLNEKGNEVVERKHTAYHQYYDSYEEAINSRISELNNEKESLKSKLEKIENSLVEAKKLKQQNSML